MTPSSSHRPSESPEREALSSEAESALLEEALAEEASYQNRKRAARLFALVGIAVFVVWGASWIKQAFPHRVEVRYVYQDVTDVHRLQKVVAQIKGDEGTKAQVIFFHHNPLPQEGANVTRRQRLDLPKGDYRVNVALHFPQTIRRMNARLYVQQAGTYYVYLKKANPALQ